VYEKQYQEIFNISQKDVEFEMPFQAVPDKLESSGIDLRKIRLFT
jgi:hypothetical protein